LSGRLLAAAAVLAVFCGAVLPVAAVGEPALGREALIGKLVPITGDPLERRSVEIDVLVKPLDRDTPLIFGECKREAGNLRPRNLDHDIDRFLGASPDFGIPAPEDSMIRHPRKLLVAPVIDAALRQELENAPPPENLEHLKGGDYECMDIVDMARMTSDLRTRSEAETEAGAKATAAMHARCLAEARARAETGKPAEDGAESLSKRLTRETARAQVIARDAETVARQAKARARQVKAETRDWLAGSIRKSGGVRPSPNSDNDYRP